VSPRKRQACMCHMNFCWFAVSAAACEVAVTLGTLVTCVAPSSTGSLVASVALLVLRAAALSSTRSEGKPGAGGRLKLSSALAAKPPPLSAFAVPVRTTRTHHPLGGSAQQRLPACGGSVSLPPPSPRRRAASHRATTVGIFKTPSLTVALAVAAERQQSTCCSSSCSCSGAAGLLELKRRVE
jgi:hypothetical protein